MLNRKPTLDVVSWTDPDTGEYKVETILSPPPDQKDCSIDGHDFKYRGIIWAAKNMIFCGFPVCIGKIFVCRRCGKIENRPLKNE